MKRKMVAKCLLLALVALTAISAFSDVAYSATSAISRVKWIDKAMWRYSSLMCIGIPCSAAGAFIVAFLLSVRRKRPSIMLWLAFYAPVAFLLPIVWHEGLFITCFLSIFGISAVSGLISVVHCFFERQAVRAVLLLFAIPGFFVALLYLGGHIWAV